MDIKVRLADISDADLLLEWRQDPVTVANSHSTVAIDHDEHIKWFESRLSSDLSIILMGYFSDYNEPIGMVRFDKTEDQIWSVSINLSRIQSKVDQPRSKFTPLAQSGKERGRPKAYVLHPVF